LLQFFYYHGTHGLETASFGQKCTSSVFMEAGQTSDAYEKFQSDTNSYEAGMLWFNSSGESKNDNDDTQSTSDGFKFSFSNRRCEGELKRDSTCAGGMIGTKKDAPTIVNWSFKPIWEMKVPGFNPQAKAAMERTVEAVMVSAVECTNKSCSGRGSCAGNADKWKYISRVRSLDELFDPSKCFCFDGVEGDKCNQQPKPSDKLTKSPLTNNYWNRWDGKLEYDAKHNGKRAAVSSMSSTHNNNYEDRRFKFRVTVPEGYTSFSEKRVGVTNSYNAESHVECPDNWALTSITSIHSNHYEDRKWSYKCGKFGGWHVGECNWTGWVNDYDEQFTYDCPGEKVMGGMNSIHSNYYQDRIFRFKCCKMTKATLPPLARVIIE